MYDCIMCKQRLKLVVDNTPVVEKQPFKQPVNVTRDDVNDLRADFDEWMRSQGIHQFREWQDAKKE